MLRRRLLRSSPSHLGLVVTGFALIACGRSDMEGGYLDDEGTGGFQAVGGSGGDVTGGTGGISTGGAFPTGGTTPTGGVAGSTGGTTPTGGTAGTGGVSTGGTAPTGGTGGIATGGTAPTGGTGGISTGGSPPTGGTGGISTGGTAPTGGAGGGPAECGNGVLDFGEECDFGDENEDAYALVLRVGNTDIPVWPLERTQTGVQFYARSGNSSHTGYEALGASRIMLQRDTRSGVVSLIIHSGVETAQPQASVGMALTGVPTTASVALSDDTNEFFAVTLGVVAGSWSFKNQSDGGVLSGLSVPGNWNIKVQPSFSAAIDSFGFVSAKGLIALPLSGSVQLIAKSTPAECRTDCTVPICGDGVFDAGELCDDGNTLDGDGCAADCASF